MAVLIELTDFNSFYFGRGFVVLKGLILTVSTLQGFGGHKSIEFNSFYSGGWWLSCKN